jgi:hypothetical protein
MDSSLDIQPPGKLRQCRRGSVPRPAPAGVTMAVLSAHCTARIGAATDPRDPVELLASRRRSVRPQPPECTPPRVTPLPPIGNNCCVVQFG